MTCWVIAPIKAPEQCKTRLTGVLDDAQRVALAAAMLRHVVERASAADNIDRVLVLGPSLHDLPPSTPMLPDLGGGLNAELVRATRNAAGSVDRLIILAADLPAVTREDIEALARTPANTIAIAPDRSGMGTNALSLPLPAAGAFQFQFGQNSFESHCAEVARLGLPLSVVRSTTLALDIDEPSDLTALPAQFRTLI